MKTNNVKVKAVSKYVRISPLKVRRILDQIRNRSCSEALLILKFMPQKSCLVISGIITAAVANAKSNFGLDTSSLLIIEARADEGPSLKRFCPHAQGRGFPIKKRMSHIVSLVCNLIVIFYYEFIFNFCVFLFLYFTRWLNVLNENFCLNDYLNQV